MADEVPWEERPDVMQAALEARQQRARSTPVQPERKRHDDDIVSLPVEPASVLAAGAIPVREFLDSANIFPHRNVALLGGDGGVGKSLLAMQLALSCTTGSTWLGLTVMQGPVVYFSAEDDRDEIKIRLREISAAEGVDLEEAYQLYPIYMAGEDAVLAFEKQGRLEVTKLFQRLRRTLEELNPVLLILDNLADIFAGNENNRSLAKQFIGLLRGLAIEFDCVVLLLAHPSLAGLSAGTGTSGSTAWSNSVRVRLYLTKPESADADANDRVLEVKKANYGPAGTKLHMKWAKGRLVRAEPVNVLDALHSAADFDHVAAKLSTNTWRVSEQSEDWGGFAVAEVLDIDAGRHLAAKDRSPEQEKNRSTCRRLLSVWVAAKTIGIVELKDSYRRPTKYYTDKVPKEGKRGSSQ